MIANFRFKIRGLWQRIIKSALCLSTLGCKAIIKLAQLFIGGEYMADINKELNVLQGYNFSKDKQAPCGFVKKLKIGDKEFAADQKVKDILSPESDIQVVGVLRMVEWDTSVTGPVSVAMQVSTKNKAEIKMLTLNSMTKTDVTYQFSCYEYDSDEKQFYESFHCNGADLIGVLQKNGEKLELSIGETPSHEVQQPENYTLVFKVAPKKMQALHLAVSVENKAAKQWGIDLS